MSGKFQPNKDLSGDDHIENTKNRYITVTEDKLYRCAREFKDGIRSRSNWAVPAGFFVSLGATILTASFTDKFGQNAEFWSACFHVGFFAVIIWLVVVIVSLVKNYKKGRLNHFLYSAQGIPDPKDSFWMGLWRWFKKIGAKDKGSED